MKIISNFYFFTYNLFLQLLCITLLNPTYQHFQLLLLLLLTDFLHAAPLKISLIRPLFSSYRRVRAADEPTRFPLRQVAPITSSLRQLLAAQDHLVRG